jgi:hypothetical protein
MFKTHVIKLKCTGKDCKDHQKIELQPEHYNSVATDINHWKSIALCDDCLQKKMAKRAKEFRNFMGDPNATLAEILNGRRR